MLVVHFILVFVRTRHQKLATLQGNHLQFTWQRIPIERIRGYAVLFRVGQRLHRYQRTKQIVVFLGRAESRRCLFHRCVIVVHGRHPEFAEDLALLAEQILVDAMIEKDDLRLAGLRPRSLVDLNVNVARVRIGMDEAGAEDLLGEDTD